MVAEARVGIFFVVFVLLAVATAVYLKGVAGAAMGRSIEVYFNNVEGLVQGAKVLLAGKEIGRVVDIRLATPEELQRYPDRTVVVRIALQRGVVLYDTDEFVIAPSGLLGDTNIAIRRKSQAEREAQARLLGQPVREPVPIPQGGIAFGERATGIAELSEEGREVLRQARDALARVRAVYATPAIEKQLPAILSNVEQATRNASHFTQTLVRVALENEARIGQTATQIAAAAGALNQTARQIYRMTAASTPRIESATARVARMVNRAAADIEGATAAAHDSLAQTSENIKRAAQRLETMTNATAAEVEASAKLTRTALAEVTGNLQRTAERTETMVKQSANDVEAMTRRAREALDASAGSLERSSQRVEQMVNATAGDVEASARAARELVAKTSENLERTAQRIERMASTTAQDVEAITATARQSMSRTAAMIEEATQAASAELAASAKRVRELVDASAGNLERTAAQVEKASANVAQLVDRVSSDVTASTGRISQLVQVSARDLESTSANLAALTEQFRADLAAMTGRTQAMVDTSATNIERSTARIATLTERSADDIERTTRRIHDLIVATPLPGDLAVAGAHIRQAAANVEEITKQLQASAKDLEIAGPVKATARNLELASAHLVAASQEGAGLISDTRQAVGKVTALATQEEMWADLRQTLSQLRQAMEDLQAITSQGRKTFTDPKVSQDITEAVANIRELTASGLEVVKKADRSLTRVDNTMDKMQNIARHLQPTSVSGYSSLEGSRDAGLRADFVTDLYFGAGTSSFWRVGIRDLGDAESLILQRAFDLGSGATARLGVLGNKAALGLTYPFGRRLWLELDLWNPNAPRLDVRGQYGIGREWSLLFGANELFSGTDPFVGIRRNLGGGRPPQKAAASASGQGPNATESWRWQDPPPDGVRP